MSTNTHKTVVITGANRGIGYAMASICKKRGDTVYALCRQSSKELDALGVNVVEQIDVATQAGIDKAVSALNGIAIDLLINNAGILRNEQLSDLNQETILEQFNVNAVAPLFLSHALLENLSSGSKIALITSRMGSVTDNTSGGRYGYFTPPHLETETCRYFYMCYIIYKTTWLECFEIKKRILTYKK